MTPTFKSRWAPRVRAILGRRVTMPSMPVPSVPAESEWEEAFVRVESYLRAHQVRSRVVLNRLTNEIIAAARLLPQDPSEPPVAVAIRVAQARLGDWLVQVMGEGDWADERFRARGRLALLMAGVPSERPDDFLAASQLPSEVRDRFAARLQPGPELKLASMPPAPLELPIGDAVERKWETFSRSAFLRSAGTWLVIAGLAGLAWVTTR